MDLNKYLLISHKLQLQQMKNKFSLQQSNMEHRSCLSFPADKTAEFCYTHTKEEKYWEMQPTEVHFIFIL